jgi:hypothetical protein
MESYVKIITKAAAFLVLLGMDGKVVAAEEPAGLAREGPGKAAGARLRTGACRAAGVHLASLMLPGRQAAAPGPTLPLALVERAVSPRSQD